MDTDIDAASEIGSEMNEAENARTREELQDFEDHLNSDLSGCRRHAACATDHSGADNDNDNENGDGATDSDFEAAVDNMLLVGGVFPLDTKIRFTRDNLPILLSSPSRAPLRPSPAPTETRETFRFVKYDTGTTTQYNTEEDYPYDLDDPHGVEREVTPMPTSEFKQAERAAQVWKVLKNTPYKKLHENAREALYSDSYDPEMKVMKPLVTKLMTYARPREAKRKAALARSRTRKVYPKCIVRGCGAIFASTDQRDAHIDRHFKPRFLCPGPCGGWFHGFSELQSHLQKQAPQSVLCSAFVRDELCGAVNPEEMFEALPRWWRCPRGLLVRPTLKADRDEFTEAMTKKKLVLAGETAQGLPKGLPPLDPQDLEA